MVNDTVTTEKGPSLSRGPALVLGTILLAFGLFSIYKQHTFAPFSQFPSGHAHVTGKVLFGIFGVNGWTGMLTAVGGGLLLFGAAQHLLAKTMSLIVGVALGAAAIIALLNHGNVLGMAAANALSEIGWGASAVILLFNTLIPRRRREVVVEGAAGGAAADRDVERSGSTRTHRHETEAAAAGVAVGAAAEHHHETRAHEREAARDESGTVVGDHRSEHATVAHDPGDRDRTAVHDQGDEPATVAHPTDADGNAARSAQEREQVFNGSED